MKDNQLIPYLNKKVEITFWDGTEEIGILHREEDFPNDPNKLRNGGYLLKHCFTGANTHFKKSHITKIKAINGDIKK